MPTDFLEKVAKALKGVEGVENIAEFIMSGNSADRIFVIGNGGSAALASHFASDLNKFTPYEAWCLSDNIPLLTATANDVNYEVVFADQIDKFGSSGDILVAISSSGNSPNIIKAIQEAKEKKMTVITLTGFNGGMAKIKADFSIHIPTEKGEYELVESVHGAVLHYLILCLKK